MGYTHPQEDRGKFLSASEARITELQKYLPDDEQIEWHVQKGYRGSKRKEIEKFAKDNNVMLRWYKDADDFASAINNTSSGNAREGSEKISSFDFFGHGEQGNWWLAGNSFFNKFEKSDIGKISSSAFQCNAQAQSWACRSAVSTDVSEDENGRYPVTFIGSFTSEWYHQTGVPMKGAIGKTDYTASYSDRGWFWPTYRAAQNKPLRVGGLPTLGTQLGSDYYDNSGIPRVPAVWNDAEVTLFSVDRDLREVSKREIY